MDNIFLQKKKGKKINKLRPPDWPQYRPPATPETDFFLGWPENGDVADPATGLTHCRLTDRQNGAPRLTQH